jgi:exopolyphosphatase/guanosine-5'-triphosphate,3'-diphosphate pyrophosphatase
MTSGTSVAEPGGASAGIVPRWEWRTFGEEFGAAEVRFSALTPDHVDESDETYLLSLRSDASVKVRDGLMDVKHLEQVNDDGLEQWLPVLKAGFPLSASDVGAVLAALGATVPAPARAASTLDELVDEVVRPSTELQAMKVHKHRRHFLVHGCMAELTELQTDRGATRTIAIESEDPALVSAIVSELGLGERPNVCLARGLKALVGIGGRRYAVVDVGTNSVKFNIAERAADGVWRTLVDRAEITRLGEGLAETGRLEPEPMERTTEAIADMSAEAKRYGVEETVAVGTAGLRLAPNSAALVDAVAARSGVRIEVVSGEEEARLAYVGATAELELPEGAVVVFDTGGGSSQFTFGHGSDVEERFSVDVGAARFTEGFGLDGAVSESVLASALEAISRELNRLDGRPAPEALVGMGGAVTNMAAVKHARETYDPDLVQGTVLDLGEIDRQIELYRTRTADERRSLVGLQPKRAEVILAGACIVRTIVAKLGRESLVVSDRGLRHGLRAERFGP